MNTTPDFIERISILRSCEHSQVWNAVRMSLRDEIEDRRRQLESDVTPEDSERFRQRIFLRALQDIEEGSFFQAAARRLEGQIEALKQKVKEANRT